MVKKKGRDDGQGSTTVINNEGETQRFTPSTSNTFDVLESCDMGELGNGELNQELLCQTKSLKSRGSPSPSDLINGETTKGLKMGSLVEAIQAAKVYRHLLKAVKKHVGKEEQKSHFIEFISQEFRTSHEQLDLSSIHQKIKLARDYTFLLNSVHHHKDLLFSYNIAVDRSDEMKKVLGKSAASVGLQLPEVYQS
ncbi:unnamed protein product [Camellia sinensis]